MPTIDLCGDSADFLRVFAVMAHPGDERMRQEFLACAISRVFEDEVGDVEIPATILRALLHSPSMETVFDRAAESARGGSVAGDVLLYLAEMAKTGVNEPSIRKAIYVASDYLSDATCGDGKKPGASDPSIRKAWEEFKPVAHLWAAFRICQFGGNEFPSLPFDLDGDAFSRFLSVADFFLSFGEDFQPTRSKNGETALIAEDVWRLPKEYRVEPIKLSIDSLPYWMIDRLNSYRKREYI